MAKHAGHEGKVKSGSTAVGEVTSFEIETTADTAESHAMGATWKTRIPTFKDWSGTVECHYDPEDAGQNAFAVGASVTVSLYSAGDGTGDKYLTGPAIVTNRGVGVPMDDMVSLSLTLAGNGALTEATVSA